MFTNILVPLDGSRMAEAALPAAGAVAKLFSASITLVHVIEKNAPTEIHGETHLSDPVQAETYLHEVALRSFPADARISYHVHTAEIENVAGSIAGHIGELGADLVVMCTHGHGGMRDLFFGNIAQQVIALGKTPVLFIPPTQDGTAPSFNCHRILVPLDGQTDHERGLLKTEEFARVCGAFLHLLMVVPTIETLPGKLAAHRRMTPGATTVMLDIQAEEAGQYLLKLRRKLESNGFIVTDEILRGDPASLIIETAQKIRADLIVVGTHAKFGMDAFWSESVAPKICKQCRIPLLFVPLK